MRQVFYKVIISAVFLFLFFPNPAHAQFNIFPKGGVEVDKEGIRVGRLEIHPGFTFESRYEDNVFLSDGHTEDPTDDFIFVNRPSMLLELKRGAGEFFGFNFEYSGEDEHYINLSESEDAFDHYLAAALNLGGPGGRTDLTVGGSLDFSSSVQDRDFITNISNRVDNTVKTAYLDLILSLSRIFKASINMDAEERKFGGSNRTENQDTYNAGGSVFWEATSKTAYGIKYNHRFGRYETPAPNNADSDSDQILFGMRWSPTALVSGDFFVGYENKRFENFSGEDRQDFIYQIALNYTPRERTRISLDGNREIVNSTFGSIQSSVSSNISLRLVQQILNKFTAEAAFFFENRDYQRSSLDSADGTVKTRVDNTFGPQIALLYDIQRWLQAKAEYRYETNKSNFDTRDYEANVGLVSISAKY